MVHKSKVVAAVLLLVLALFTFFTNTHAEGKNKNEAKVTKSGFTEIGIKNLEVAVASENTGLRKSGIYLSGVYELSEMVEPLKAQLKVEEKPDIRVLIALTLYKIGSRECIETIRDLTVNDSNKGVRRLSQAILNEFTASTEENISIK